jgi:2,4-dienoyl-CoA reductase-like NADH-dependent reductase (Old Yellow Enzyme family)
MEPLKTNIITDTDQTKEVEEIDLLSPLTIRGVNLRNRIGLSPMCQYCAKEGLASDWHLVHLGSRAVGGAALVMVEATAVTRNGRISPGDMGIWDDCHIEPLARIAHFILSQGSIPGIQLAHSGRKGSCEQLWKGGKQLKPENEGWQTIAPSSIPFNATDSIPKELNKVEIEEITKAFEVAAKRALKAGFQIIEIHSAHGYLLHEFLSPLSNKRNDQYGGDIENRIRLLVSIATSLRKLMPEEFPLFTRISAIDWVEGGWDIQDSIFLSKKLKERGVDLIDVSSGGIVPKARISTGKGYQVPFAKQIRHSAEILTAAVGLITEVQHANEIITQRDADLVFLGREFLREPYWVQKAIQKLGKESFWPVQYAYAVKNEEENHDN